MLKIKFASETMDFKTILVVLTLIASSSQAPEIKTLYTNGPGYSEYFPLRENLAAGNTLRFSVRAWRDAHILLATSPKRDQPEYEIILGALGNTINYIRGRYPDQKEANSAVRTVNLLNPKEYRNIWIKLKTDSRNESLTIQIGIGDEVFPFQEWRDTTPLNPQYLSFRSGSWASWRYGYGDEGFTIGLPRYRQQSVITVDKSGSPYGQYHPLSDIINNSEDESTTFYFTVKTTNEFQILLSPTASSSDNRYEFGLRRTSAYLLRQQAATTRGSARNLTRGYAEVSIPNDNSRLGYWIKLNRDGQVMLGKGSSVEPILFWHDSEPIIPQFVGFTLIKEEENFNPTSFAVIEYGLGPDYTIDSQDCTPRWKNSIDQKLPPGAVRGGYADKTELYVCRATHAELFIPGTFVIGNDDQGECHLPYDINVQKKTDFQVLTGCRFIWVAANLGSPSGEGAVSAGENPNNNLQYVARLAYADQIIPGKHSRQANTAYFTYKDQELSSTEYELLFQADRN